MRPLRVFAVIVLLCTIVLGALTEAASRRTISTVRRSGRNYTIVDNRGRRAPAISVAADSDFIGYNTLICIVRWGSDYYFYDVRGVRYETVDTGSIGRIYAVTGETFTAGWDSLRITYDSRLHVLSRRIFPSDTATVADSVDVPLDSVAQMEVMVESGVEKLE